MNKWEKLVFAAVAFCAATLYADLPDPMFDTAAETTVDFGDRKAEAGAENLEFSGTDYGTVNVNVR